MKNTVIVVGVLVAIVIVFMVTQQSKAETVIFDDKGNPVPGGSDLLKKVGAALTIGKLAEKALTKAVPIISDAAGITQNLAADLIVPAIENLAPSAAINMIGNAIEQSLPTIAAGSIPAGGFATIAAPAVESTLAAGGSMTEAVAAGAQTAGEVAGLSAASIITAVATLVVLPAVIGAILTIEPTFEIPIFGDPNSPPTTDQEKEERSLRISAVESETGFGMDERVMEPDAQETV